MKALKVVLELVAAEGMLDGRPAVLLFCGRFKSYLAFELCSDAENIYSVLGVQGISVFWGVFFSSIFILWIIQIWAPFKRLFLANFYVW